MRHERRIAYITPSGSDPFEAHYRTTLGRAALGGTEVTCVGLAVADSGDSPFLPPYPFFHGEMFRCVKQLEDDGYDGAIIGCSADPGLLDARRMARMPVTAPLEANLRLAAMLGRRVTVFVPGNAGERVQYEDLARLYGLRHVIASVVPVDLGYPPDAELARLMRDDRDALVDAVLGCHRRFVDERLDDIGRRAIEDDGAGVLYLGCTLWSGMAAGAGDRLGVPVLDPMLGALRAAEALADVSTG